jgi:hypothetical protein
MTSCWNTPRNTFMKTLAVVCNIVLFTFTCIVLVTDGVPMQAAYIVFTLLSLLVPILSLVVISRSRVSGGWLGPHVKRKPLGEKRKTEDRSFAGATLNSVAVVCNIVLFGFVCWALMDQYPHPEEEGVIPFAVLMVLTPVLSMVVIVRAGVSGRLGNPLRTKASKEPV